MHIKRTKMPKTWPVPRKGKRQRFIAVATHASTKSISLLAILRDILKIAETRKEVKHIVNNGDVKVNNKIRKSDTFPVQTFDTISLEKSKKYYVVEIVNRKFALKEISKKEAGLKIIKILGKTILANKKIQMNLEDGHNVLTDIEFNVGDSVIYNTILNKIEKILSLKKGANVEIVIGKHAGKKGKVLDIELLKRGKNYKIKLDDVEVLLPYKTILVIN